MPAPEVPVAVDNKMPAPETTVAVDNTVHTTPTIADTLDRMKAVVDSESGGEN
jgi:hypothetical protein